MCKQEPLCCAETLSRLLKQGCKLPDPAEISVTDPKLLGWLHEPQLLQRDEREIEGYTLQVPASFQHPLQACCLSLLCICQYSLLAVSLTTPH